MSTGTLAKEWREVDEQPAPSLDSTSIPIRLTEVLFDASVPPPDEPVVFSIGGVEICHPGNITVIEAHLKTGKSAFVAAGIASAFASTNVDCLGWRSDSNPRNLTVLHFDTEQSRRDHHRLIVRALGGAGRSINPKQLKSYCVTGWDFSDMRAAVYAAVEDSGVHSIWIDGAADLVASPNDEQQAFSFVRWLQELAIVNACPVIVVLHLNPGKEGKSRGHLGSELNRKAEAVLRITKDANGISTVITQWTRHAPILKINAPRFAWCNEKGKHVSVLGVVANKSSIDFSEAQRILASVWPEDTKAVQKYEDLVRQVVSFLKKGESTAKRKIGFMLAMNLIAKTPHGKGYVLTPEGLRCCGPERRS